MSVQMLNSKKNTAQSWYFDWFIYFLNNEGLFIILFEGIKP